MFEDKRKEVQLSGFQAETTNNQMELMAPIKALEHIVENGLQDSQINIYTDSQYVRNGITLWSKRWRDNGWRTGEGKPVKNKELWQRLRKLDLSLSVEWHWVKGHRMDYHNIRVDALAGEARKRG